VAARVRKKKNSQRGPTVGSVAITSKYSPPQPATMRSPEAIIRLR
jgi:hypothetical protein